MKLPRDLSGDRLALALARVGCRVPSPTGSHIRLTREGSPQPHLTTPAHDELRAGTLSAVSSMAADSLQFG
ncbi:MAG: type II toxin-antitoxin system HicA family toxin [Burkholderiales bacterium]|nr:type II toxin-antitoxin system HicA family toxin [Burkholderiales bacterium]